jgi:hypothetical protein
MSWPILKYGHITFLEEKLHNTLLRRAGVEVEDRHRNLQLRSDMTTADSETLTSGCETVQNGSIK